MCRECQGDDQMDLSNSRVLITGGAGLIGSHIADRLVKEDVAEIVIFDNFVRGREENLDWVRNHGQITVVTGDIRDRRLVSEVMEGVDCVFHQAAIRITQCAEEPRLALEVLVDGTFNVCEAAVEAGVQKIITASSASVYGMADIFPTQEHHHPYHNRTLYGSAKLFNEGLLRSFYEQYGLPYVALRYFNVFGPRMDIHGAYTEVLIRWMERIANGESLVIHGDGTQTMDFVYVEDVANANVLAAKSDLADRVLNVGSGIETSLIELAEAFCHAMGVPVRVEHGPERKVNGVTRRLADVNVAKTLIGFQAEFSLEEGIRRLVNWWKVQQVSAGAA